MYTLLNPDTGEEIAGYRSPRLTDVVQAARGLHAQGMPAHLARETADGGFIYLIEPDEGTQKYAEDSML